MNPEQYYKRASGLLDTRKLEGKCVAVIGLGSGGSRVAAELGRLGISLLLLDRPGECLEEHNLVRHVLGRDSLGKSKIAEMKKFIRRLNPATEIYTADIDVTAQADNFNKLLEQHRPYVLAVCTDNEPSKHAVNFVAVALRIPQIGAGVYDGGIGGEVYRVLPGDACYGCIAAQLQAHEQIPKGAPPDYNSHADPQIVTTCALNLDIEQIALLQSRMLLDLLQEKNGASVGLPPGVNVWVFSNRRVPGTFARPFHGEFFSLSRQPDCLTCGCPPENLDVEHGKILSALQGSPAFT